MEISLLSLVLLWFLPRNCFSCLLVWLIAKKQSFNKYLWGDDWIPSTGEISWKYQGLSWCSPRTSGPRILCRLPHHHDLVSFLTFKEHRLSHVTSGKKGGDYKDPWNWDLVIVSQSISFSGASVYLDMSTPFSFSTTRLLCFLIT